MKKTIFVAIIMIFTMGAITTFASNNDKKVLTENPAIPVKTDNKLTTEEESSLKNRIEEIRSTDKSGMSAAEKSELRKESREIKKNVRKNGSVVYIGGTTLLIIILIILLV